jgi:hypothetical protein
MSFDWKELLRTVAPGMATALGGPVAGIATAAISSVLLGKPDGSEGEIAKAMAGATPDVLLKLKEAEGSFMLAMKKLDVDLEEVSAKDRASARDREVALKDKTPQYIAAVSFLGFFAVLGMLVMFPVQAGAKDALLILLGTLNGIVVSIIAYYYGTSSGSTSKSKDSAELTKTLLDMLMGEKKNGE